MLNHVLHMKTISLAEEKQILKTIQKQLVEQKFNKKMTCLKINIQTRIIMQMIYHRIKPTENKKRRWL